MNIFVLDLDPIQAARMQCDKHVVKMVLESAQMLSTIAREVCDLDAPYRSTHKNHPCIKWILQSKNNYIYLGKLADATNKEYSYRYEKQHAYTNHIEWLQNNIPDLPDINITDFPKCMPEEYKTNSTIDSYREYYKYGKSHLHKWKKRNKPQWLN